MSATRRPDDGIERGRGLRVRPRDLERDENSCIGIVRAARRMVESRLLVPNEIYLPRIIWEVLLRYTMRHANTANDVVIRQDVQSFRFDGVNLKNHSGDNIIFVHCFDRAVFVLTLGRNEVTLRNFMAINEIERSNDRPGTRYEVESLRPVERAVDTPRNEGQPMTPNV